MPKIRIPRQALWMALALVALGLAGLVWARSRATPAVVHTVRAAELVQSLAVSGRAVSETRVFLGATVTGRVAEVARREGDNVRAGEVLVRLEDAEALATARQAEAAWRSAEARLKGQRALAAPVATQQYEQARANAESAERERQRSEQLFAQGFIGQSRLDEVRRAAEVARAAQRAAEVQRDANVSGTELQQAEARVAEARGALDLARARLAQTRITAPAEATVLARMVEPGQIVQPGGRLVELSVRGPVQLVAQVDEKYLARLTPGMAATAVADAFPGQGFAARIVSIAPLVDAQRGAVEVKFSLAGPGAGVAAPSASGVPAPPAAVAAAAPSGAMPPALKNDMTVSIEIVTGRRARALALPGDALRAGPAVLVVADGRAQLRPVKLGLRTLAMVEVSEGLREGEQVVLDASVAPGTRVRAVPRETLAGEGLDVGTAMRGLGRD